MYFLIIFTITFGSSHPEVFLKKGTLKTCNKFRGEHSCQSAISITLLCSFIEVTLQHGRSPVNLRHIFRTPFYENTYGGLLLNFETLLTTLVAASEAKTVAPQQKY